MKKITAILLVVALATVAIAGSTLAYFQDEASAVNVATVGNVKIEQHEYERVVGADGKWVPAAKTDKYGYTPDMLQKYTQGKPLFPAVFADGDIKWDDRVNGTHQQSWAQVGASGSNQLFDDSVKNALDKFVFVENTGKSDAYVRTWIALEQGSVEADNFKNVIMTNRDKDHWSWETVATDVEIDDNEYVIMCATYLGPKSNPTGILAPGAVTYPSLLQYYMKPGATNEDAEAIDGNGNGLYEILAFSQAVQTAGFADAETALNAAFGADHPWKNTVIVATDDKTELKNALSSGKDVILSTDVVQIDDATFNGNGTSVTLAGAGDGAYGYLAFLPEAGEDTTVENLNVSGTGFVEVGHWGMGGGDYTVNNLVLKDMSSTLANGDKGFTLGCTFCHYGNAVLNNCIMTGATANDPAAMAVDAGFVNDTTTVVNGGEYGTIYCWSHAVVTIDDAEVDTLYVAPIKGTVTIEAGTHVGTINVAYGTSAAKAGRLAKLIIEDGAKIDKIVFSDVNNVAEKTFSTVAEWNAFVATFNP